MSVTRRSLLRVLPVLICAPAIVRASSLMAIKPYDGFDGVEGWWNDGGRFPTPKEDISMMMIVHKDGKVVAVSLIPESLEDAGGFFDVTFDEPIVVGKDTTISWGIR